MSDDNTVMISLKLLVDKERNKVVFAEAGQDFVDILFSLLTLPMGTIVRLLEKSNSSVPIGCFNNIYASVASMSMTHFSTQASKQMLLYPGSLNHDKYQKIKLRIDDSQPTKCFMCPMFVRSGQCSKGYSNFNTSRCSSCGNLMNESIQLQGSQGGRASGGVFVRSCNTSFMITDDLKVEVNSVMSTLKLLKELGYTDGCDELVELILDINLQEVTTLLECLFTSDTPLTDAFLKKKSSCGIKRKLLSPPPAMISEERESKADQTITVNAYVRKKEGDIMYVECDEDFVNLLFTFLAIPLESVWGRISGGNGVILGCVGNLCKSFKELSVVDPGRKECVVPHYYKCQKKLQLLLDDVVTTLKPPTYYRFVSFSVNHFREYCLTEKSDKRLVYDWDKLLPVTCIDPKLEGNNNTTTADQSSGFVKRGTKFMVSDDLVITPSNSASVLGMLKDKQISLEDVECRVICMKQEEVIKLLRASLVTFTALSTGLLAMESASTSVPESRFYKKPKIET